MMRRVDSFGGGFVEILPELAPLSSRVLGNEVWIEVDPFPLLVLIDILSFICRSSGPSG